MVGATARLTSLSADRSAIDPATGLPGAGRELPPVHGRSDLHPLDWPLGPGAFLAAAASLGNRFTLGLATYTPFAQRVRFDPADGEQPNRYHAVSTDLRNLALVPALSIRLGGGVRIGAAPGFLFSVGRHRGRRGHALGAAAPAGWSPAGPRTRPRPRATTSRRAWTCSIRRWRSRWGWASTSSAGAGRSASRT